MTWYAVLVLLLVHSALTLEECGSEQIRKTCPAEVKASDFTGNGGWGKGHVVLDTDKCDIERRHIDSFSREEFLEEYNGVKPVIIEGWNANWKSQFSTMCTKEMLLTNYGNRSIILSTANKNSYEKQTASLVSYLSDIMLPPPVVRLGNTTWYHFGNNDHESWTDLFDCYLNPEQFMSDPSFFSYSFGMGASGSGVPFHTHGPVFNEVIFGRKRWWLKPPGVEPLMHPDESAMQWLFTHYSHNDYCPASEPIGDCGVQECVIEAGEIIYIPGMWHHSTLNIGDTVFMAIFV